MRVWERWTIRIWTWAALILSGAVFSILIPGIMDVQSWIYEGWDFILFPIWFLSGIVLGIALSVIIDRWPKRTRSIAARGLIVLFAYFGIAIVIALVTGEGEGFSRIGGSGPIKIWGMAVWSMIALGPSMFGVVGIMNRSKWARGGSALAFITLAATTMIFKQARSAEVLSQDPLLSILFVAALVAYVEGVNWSKRYLVEDESAHSLLWRRQVSFTVLFLVIASVMAFLPFILSETIIPSYEGEMIFGRALTGALLMIPLALIALGKNILDAGRKD